MHKVNSSEKMQGILYKVNSFGMADVWLRKNQEKVIHDVTIEDKIHLVDYEADEVYFQVTPELVSEEEITVDADFWFEQLKESEKGCNADYLSISEFKSAKREEISKACENVIYAGIDVELSSGTEHFSLTEKDQINLFGKQAQLVAGAEKLEYHQDGNPCKYYTVEEMNAIITAAMSFVSFQTTYCNSMYMWLEGCVKASEMTGITYGTAVPERYWSEVLADYMKVQEV